MQEPSKRVPFRHLYACWVGGVLGTFMGGAFWFKLLSGHEVYYKNGHRYLTFGESALIATGILVVGVLLLWVAVKITPPAK